MYLHPILVSFLQGMRRRSSRKGIGIYHGTPIVFSFSFFSKKYPSVFTTLGMGLQKTDCFCNPLLDPLHLLSGLAKKSQLVIHH